MHTGQPVAALGVRRSNPPIFLPVPHPAETARSQIKDRTHERGDRRLTRSQRRESRRLANRAVCERA